MALSKRFGQIQHIAERYEEKRSEEHEILKKLIGKTSLFKYSTPLDFTSEDRDLREITENESEEETVNPQWKAEFQAILRRSKHKTESNDLQDFEIDLKTKQTIHTSQTLMSRDQYPLDQVLKDKRTESSINEGQGSEVPSLIKAGTVFFGEGDSNNTDSDKIPLIKHSKEDVMNIIYNTVVVDKIENGLVDDTNVFVNQVTGCTTDVDTDADKFRLTSNIKQPCQKRSKQEHVCCHHDDRQKENMVKKVQASKTKEIKAQKNVIKVVPAFSFPLDELLPLETDHPNKLGAPHNERNTGHKCNTRNNNASSNSQTKPTVTDFQESIFHGEVYNSPNCDSEPTLDRSTCIPATGDVCQSLIGKCSSNQVSEYLGNEVPMASNNPRKDTSLENFSFIMEALHNGNSSFVEHLQNVISQQIRCNVSTPVERSEEKSKGFAIAGQLNCPNHEGYGFYSELNSDAEATFEKNRSMFEKDEEEDHKRNENFVSEKGDNLDKQSKELFKLFIQQCSQLVRTDQDKKMLESLVQLLKKESGTDLGITGLTPPSVKHKTVEKSSPTESIHSANMLADKDTELFEGRTLLKGFVQPRHIPKTTTVKSGRDKPTDPRPISTLLAKTSPKPLPLPQFVHDLRDDSVIQRILTLDWDSKRVLFPDEALYPDVNKRDCDSLNLYNPSTDLKKCSNLRNVQTVTNDTGLQSDLDIEFNSPKREDRHADLNVSFETPVKDEQNKSVKDKNHQLYIKVYGKVKGGMDESSADKTGDLTAQNTNNLAGTCSKSAKRALGCDFSKAAEDEDILKGRPMLRLFTTFEQQQGPVSIDINETDAISASVIDSVDKLGSLLDKTYGSKSFVCQNIFESNTNFTSETLHDNENKDIYPKKHMKDIKTDNAVREPGNQSKTAKIFHSEKHQNKMEQPSLEIRSIPTHVSLLTKQISRKTFGTHDSNNKNLIMLKDAQDNLGPTCTTHLQATSNESKTTKPCVGIVKPMQVIVISDEDESSNLDTESQKDSTRAKIATMVTGIHAEQGNARIGPSITTTDVELEEIRDYENNQCKRWDDIIEMNDGINSVHVNTDGTHRKRKHLPICVAQDYEEGQLISDSGSELDVKRKKSEKKSENMRRVPHVRKRHYRERKRHSSSSSAESLNFVDWSERSEAKRRYKSSRNSSTAERKGSQRTFDTYTIKKESSKDSRKRHHSVHEGQQFSTGKISCRDTKETKRRYSEDSKVLPKCEQVNVNQNTQNATKSSYYQSILSPEYSSLSDEMLSEEYHRLFGQRSTAKVSDDKLVRDSAATKSNFMSAPVKASSTKSMQEDKAFLQQYKQKVQRKEALGFKCEIKMEKTLCIEQELEDRKFLQSCKKKLEEKAKRSNKE